MPSTITVSNTDDAGAGSLRAAIVQANLDAAQDTITFAPSVTGAITLSTALPVLSTSMVIAGPGPSTLTVARSDSVGTPDFGIFTVPVGVEVTISGLTITGGSSSTSGGGISNSGTLTLASSTLSDNSSVSGGGISNSGTLILTNSTLSGNSSDEGGGIGNLEPLILTNSTLSGNSASGYAPFASIVPGQGGGIYNVGTASIVNSTLSGNSALFGGGGGGIRNLGTLTLTNSTLSGNSASVYNFYGNGGGGIENFNTVRLTDTIVAGNTGDGVAASDIENTDPGEVTGSYNLIGTGGTGGISGGQDGNIVLTSLTGLGLSPLGDYGGPTQTMALLPSSLAIDAGIAVSGVTTDQRGIIRPQGSAPDIGAFELQPPEVLGVQRHGVHFQPTKLIIAFNDPMDVASAENLANYRLVSGGPDHRFGTRDDRTVRIRSVQYDTATFTVTLRPFHRLRLRQRFQLTILGTPPDGLKDTAGLFLDGAGTGQAGSNYVIVITDKLLVPPIVHKAGKHAAVAQRPRHR